jgi:hypothetical protein
MNYIPGFSNYLQAAVPRYARGGEVMNDMEFSDFGVGGPMLGAETVGFDIANALLGGPEQGGSYTGGMGGGSSRTEAERQQAILDVNPYVAPSQGVNPNPITSQRSGGQTGYYFANELGLPARYDDVGLPQPADPTTFDPNAKYAASAPGFVPVDQNATYRLVNGGTGGSVVYAGAGEEGLRNVFQQANKLTLDDPKNAYWGVEVLDPATGQYKRVAENQGPNGLGIVGDIAGVALPIAAAIATGGASLGVQIAAGAAAGGLGGFLSGQDPLKSALLAGATAGLGNVSGFNEAVGGALSNAGNAVKNALIPEVAKQAAAEAGGDIVVTGLSNLAKGLGAGALQGAASGVSNSLSDITGYKTPAEKFVQQPTPETSQLPADNTIVVSGSRATSAAPNYGGALSGVFEPIATDFLPKGGLPEFLPSEPTPISEPTPVDDTIVVSADRFTPSSGSPFAAAFPIPVNAMLSGELAAAQPAPTEQPTTQEPVDEILVEARKSFLPPETLAAVPLIGGLAAATTGGAAAPNVVNGIDQTTGDIVVEATPKSVAAPPPIAGIETVMPAITQGALTPAQTTSTPEADVEKKLGIKDYIDIATLLAGLIPGASGGGGGGSGGKIPTGMGALSSLFSKQLPTSTLPSGGALPATTLAAQGLRSPQDYYRYGYGPEQSFFSYATQGAPNTSRAYTGYEGSTAEDMFAAQPSRLPQPITTPIPDEPSGPSMYLPDTTRFAQGGYAVEGAGDGRDDKIPALLSDGEYVIDAETVALLGNGSNKAGAELLDSFRVKVRKQKGKKLARGEFSDNAKRPEHYMAGGKS